MAPSPLQGRKLAIPAGFEPATLYLEGKGVCGLINALDLQTISKQPREAHGCSRALGNLQTNGHTPHARGPGMTRSASCCNRSS
jgi:hypothetical protein